MTMMIKQHMENGYYVSFYWDKNNIYIVEVCPVISDNMCGYPIRRMTYPIGDKRNAEATYNRYIRKYCKTEDELKIITVCYNQKQIWNSRKEALDYFLECMCNSEGSEHQRYSTIYLKLQSGKSFCSDDC